MPQARVERAPAGCVGRYLTNWRRLRTGAAGAELVANGLEYDALRQSHTVTWFSGNECRLECLAYSMLNPKTGSTGSLHCRGLFGMRAEVNKKEHLLPHAQPQSRTGSGIQGSFLNRRGPSANEPFLPVACLGETAFYMGSSIAEKFDKCAEAGQGRKQVKQRVNSFPKFPWVDKKKDPWPAMPEPESNRPRCNHESLLSNAVEVNHWDSTIEDPGK
ncbi:hypothetical protein DFH06DRAFT_1150432 [Mycena polygramma]|nr:hypothetical protein DFH06DRAFT_1150432 [Mycena polygramma]